MRTTVLYTLTYANEEHGGPMLTNVRKNFKIISVGEQKQIHEANASELGTVFSCQNRADFR